MERKRGDMTGRISFWRGKDIYNFIDVPYSLHSAPTKKFIALQLCWMNMKKTKGERDV